MSIYFSVIERLENGLKEHYSNFPNCTLYDKNKKLKFNTFLIDNGYDSDGIMEDIKRGVGSKIANFDHNEKGENIFPLYKNTTNIVVKKQAVIHILWQILMYKQYKYIPDKTLMVGIFLSQYRKISQLPGVAIDEKRFTKMINESNFHSNSFIYGTDRDGTKDNIKNWLKTQIEPCLEDYQNAIIVLAGHGSNDGTNDSIVCTDNKLLKLNEMRDILFKRHRIIVYVFPAICRSNDSSVSWSDTWFGRSSIQNDILNKYYGWNILFCSPSGFSTNDNSAGHPLIRALAASLLNNQYDSKNDLRGKSEHFKNQITFAQLVKETINYFGQIDTKSVCESVQHGSLQETTIDTTGMPSISFQYMDDLIGKIMNGTDIEKTSKTMSRKATFVEKMWHFIHPTRGISSSGNAWSHWDAKRDHNLVFIALFLHIRGIWTSKQYLAYLFRKNVPALIAETLVINDIRDLIALDLCEALRTNIAPCKYIPESLRENS
eukprot:235803_1